MNMSKNRRDFPFHGCLASAESSPVLRTLEAQDYLHGMKCVVLDLLKFEMEIQKLGEEMVIDRYLSLQEQEYWGRLTSGKRKREWLGGRIAAKYVAAEVLSQAGNNVGWSRLSLIYDKTGRPFLVADDKTVSLPDISISHSVDLAAAMAVSKGLCGIDIQKITDRIERVRERFCSVHEGQVLFSFFNGTYKQHAVVLTKLWAAKEALRKVGKDSILPGFLQLELKEINACSVNRETDSWRFIFTQKQNGMNGDYRSKKCTVAVGLIADYVLARTTTNDTVA